MWTVLLIREELFCQTTNVSIHSVTQDLDSHRRDGECRLDDGSVGLKVVLLWLSLMAADEQWPWGESLSPTLTPDLDEYLEEC